MRLLPLLALAALLACASEPASDPDPAAGPTAPPATRNAMPSDSLDVQGWLDEVRALHAASAELDYDTLLARSRRLADRLSAVVDWRRACDTYPDPSTGEEVHDPTDPEQDPVIGRGLMEVIPLGPREAVVPILCYRGAYQGSWALAHVEGARVALVRAAALSEDFQPTASRTATFGEPRFEPDGRLFTTFVKSRGPGDCGVLTRYRLGTGGDAEILEVRARECSDVVPEDLDPTTWPVVYPR